MQREFPVNFEHVELLKKHWNFSSEKIEYNVQELIKVVKDAKEVIMSEPSLLEVRTPVLVVGDIHGQYYDLHRVFSAGGRKRSTRFLFLGDYVDRGPQSLECITCLILYKLAFPKQFFLLRGNHEAMAINRVYGFYQELREKYPEDDANLLWKSFNELFSYFPLAAIVANRILCMHGGLSPHLNSLDDIRRIRRPLEEPNSNPLACDLLWSDPMIDLVGFMPNSIRGVSVYFGENVVLDTCKRLKLDIVIRAHQMMLNGYGFFCQKKLVTVFSAPRYYPEKNNRGAVMYINRQIKAGFRILNPSSNFTRGELKFRDDFDKKDDDSSYMCRQIPTQLNGPPSADPDITVPPSPDVGDILKK